MKFQSVLLLALILPGTATSAEDSIPHGAIEAPDLVYWASLGRYEKVQAALASGADANGTDSGGYSALQAAAENNHLEIVRLLVASGADIAYDGGGHTALGLARLAGNNDVVAYLVSVGAR
jgi:ankyrin repeat protein